MALEEQEVHLYALEVLEDEDEDHDQNDDADDERRPRTTEARLSLTRERFPCLSFWLSGIHQLAVST
jgi:hypothetical protein